MKKRISKSILSFALAMVMVFGMAISSFAAVVPPSVYAWDQYGNYTVWYDMEDGQTVSFIVNAGDTLEMQFYNYNTKLFIDGDDYSPTKADIAEWKKLYNDNMWYYTISSLPQAFSVACTFNAKKNKLTIVSCDTASANSTDNDALQKYYEALEKQQKKTDKKNDKKTETKSEPTQEELLAQYYAALAKQQNKK